VIITAIVSLLVLILKGIVALIPDFSSISLPDGMVQWFVDLVDSVSYFLPIADFIAMLGIWLVVTNFRIVWNVIKRVWDLLPFT
jgi:hypothetical protein